MNHSCSLYKHVLFRKSRSHRGLLVVPLSALGGGYSFAIVEPGSWDAIDSDRLSYPSLDGCLQAGIERIEMYLAQLPNHLVEALDTADRNEGSRMVAVSH